MKIPKKIEKKVLTLKELKAEEKELKARIKGLSEQVKEFMSDEELSEIKNREGVLLCTLKTSIRKSFDSTRFKTEKPKLYEKYLKESEISTFTVK